MWIKCWESDRIKVRVNDLKYRKYIGSIDKMQAKNKGIDSKFQKKQSDDGFLMSPKIDFEEISIINSELLREFAEDKKGVLDVRAKTKAGKQIDIEIQILPTEFMPERTMFY